MPMVRLLAIASIALAAACGNSTGYNSNPPPPPPPPPPPAGGGHATTINVTNNAFSPTPDTVPAGTVTFSWAANAVVHNVTWLTNSGGALPANSGDMGPGSATWVSPSLAAGNYTYHCTHHVGMNGTLVVQ